MKREAIKYYNLCLWFAMNQYSKEYTTDQFYKVSQKIGSYENQLRKLGMSEKRIQSLIDQAARAYKESIT